MLGTVWCRLWLHPHIFQENIRWLIPSPASESCQIWAPPGPQRRLHSTFGSSRKTPRPRLLPNMAVKSCNGYAGVWLSLMWTWSPTHCLSPLYALGFPSVEAVYYSGQSWVRVITCRKIWIRISWLGSRSTWLFFMHAADVFSFQMSSVFQCVCVTDFHVKEMSMFNACFSFRRDCISPHPQATLANAFSPFWLVLSVERLLLDAFIVNTFVVAWRLHRRHIGQSRCLTTGLRSHPKVEKTWQQLQLVQVMFTWHCSFQWSSGDVHLSLQFRCHGFQVCVRSQRFQRR